MYAIDNWGKQTSPFHHGEQAVQARLGVRDKMESLGRRTIRPFMPEQHREFFARLPFVIIGSVDRHGWPWASLVAGRPGFVASPDNQSLLMDAALAPGDPLGATIQPSGKLGLLGLDQATRRRNRANVTVASTGAQGIAMTVDQSFGNCPQYIQTRAIEFLRDPKTAPANTIVERFASLDETAAEMIRASDTFFVSSYVRAPRDAGIEGVDVSHRGGRPGFVKADGNTLTIPDYAGNLHFNTLGNFFANPRAGLLFVDFETGDLLSLTGTVEILWDDDPEVKALRGAERAWRFTLDHGIRLKDALPLRWSFGD